MTHEIERRVFSIRAVTRGSKKMLSGRAAAFGTLSHDLGGFREVIAPGCFTNALKRGDETIFTMNHDPNLVMARTRNGSLRLRQSSQGLDFEADLPDTQAAKDLYALVSEGVIDSCSFAFRTDKDSWPKFSEVSAMFSQIDFAGVPRGTPIRVLEDVTLFDASAVANPAYPQGTGVSAMDPATRPHMEGASVPESVLVEARARGGHSRVLSEDEALLVRVKAKALVIRLDDTQAK